MAMTMAIVVSVQAQHEKEPESKIYKRFKRKMKFYPGTVTLKDSTVLEGVIRRYTSNLVDGDIRIVTKDGEKKLFYARQVLGYKTSKKYVTFDGEFYKEETLNRNLSLYSRIGTNTYSTGGGPNGGMMTYSTSYTMYYLKKSNETVPKYVPSTKRKFKAFASYFSECESVMKAVASGDLKYDGIQDVVGKYNRCR